MKVVILPGLDGTCALLGPFAQHFGDEFDVSMVPYPPSMTDYRDLKAYVECKLPQSDYMIVAESFGGPLAAMIAAENPPYLKGVVFVATFAKRPWPITAKFAGLLDVLPIKSPLFMRGMQLFMMGKWRNPSFTARFKDALKDVPNTTLSARLRSVLELDARPALARMTAPAMYLGGYQDWLVPARASRSYSAACDQIVFIEGPHFLLQARPKEASATILKFMSDQAPLRAL